jgi:hypothetical protein
MLAGKGSGAFFSRAVEEAIHKAAINTLRSRTQTPRAPSPIGRPEEGHYPLKKSQYDLDTRDASEKQAAMTPKVDVTFCRKWAAFLHLYDRYARSRLFWLVFQP